MGLPFAELGRAGAWLLTQALHRSQIAIEFDDTAIYFPGKFMLAWNNRGDGRRSSAATAVSSLVRTAGFEPAWEVSPELGEMLPTNFKTKRVDLGHGGKLQWTCWSGDFGNPYEREDTEADARAKMLIYLLESNLLVRV